jgi:hypothetical protein
MPQQATMPAATPRTNQWLPLLSPRALRDAVRLSGIVGAILTAWILIGLDGWGYYTTPIGVRGYHPAHRLLRPSGQFGLSFGIAAMLLMLVPFGYMALKRIPRLRSAGNLRLWLEIHIFCGIVGPVVVTYHTAFKFNGLVSVAYWSMIVVALSGFVGRYLYLRVPRTIRGVEVSEREVQARASELQESLQWSVPPAVMARLEQFEREALDPAALTPTLRGFLFGGWRIRRRLHALRGELKALETSPRQLVEALDLISERAALLRRLAYLHMTKRGFELWHAFHLPLVYVAFAIVAVHVGVVLYLGYGPRIW